MPVVQRLKVMGLSYKDGKWVGGSTKIEREGVSGIEMESRGWWYID